MSTQNITVTAGESATVTFLKASAAADDDIVFVISHLGIPLVIKRKEIAINAGVSYVVTLLPSETAALPNTGAVHTLQKVGDVESVLFTGTVTANAATGENIVLENVQQTLYADFTLDEDNTEITLPENNNIYVVGVACKSSTSANTVSVEPTNGGLLFEETLDADVVIPRFYAATTLVSTDVFVSPVILTPENFPINVSCTNWGSLKVRLYYWREPAL